jgi:glycosyltransferase involved in cell wall biosynthesis
MAKNPIVSVVTITYNHENFIEEAIDGVLMQNFDSDIELIIANDKSTDHTHQAIEDVLAKDISEHIQVRYFNHKINKGMMSNFIWSLEQAEGKYIALCEGDDYWTDPFKLQKQVDFLEANDDFVGVFTDIDVLNNGELQPKSLKLKHRTDHDFNSFFKDAWIPTLTLLFRTKCIKEFSAPPEKIVSGDLTLFAHLLTHGKLKFLDQVTGVYRQHTGGAWSGANQFKILSNRIELNKYLKNKYARQDKSLNLTLKKRIQKSHFKKAKLFKRKGDYINMTLSLIKSKL